MAMGRERGISCHLSKCLLYFYSSYRTFYYPDVNDHSPLMKITNIRSIELTMTINTIIIAYKCVTILDITVSTLTDGLDPLNNLN